MPEPSPIQTRGLVFFSRHRQPTHRRRRWTFAALYALVAAMLLWPWSTSPRLVLGLPVALVWVIVALTVMFAALIWLFLGEEPDGANGD